MCLGKVIKVPKITLVAYLAQLALLFSDKCKNTTLSEYKILTADLFPKTNLKKWILPTKRHIVTHCISEFIYVYMYKNIDT